MILVVGAFFALIWFGVFVLGQSGGEAMLASFATLFLLGLGITFTVMTFRKDPDDRD